MAVFAGCLLLLFTSFVLANSSNSCEDNSKVQSCAARYSYGLSVNDVFEMMASEPELLPFYCTRKQMQKCLGSCDTKFRTSKFGHTYSMCLFKNDIIRYSRCWTPSFPAQANNCYRYHFPDYRTEALYPIPMRLFSMSSIERDCFADEQDADCKYYKSLMLWNLMPTYYQIHLYPEEYRSRFI